MGETGSNVDPAELAKFERTAHRWWDPDGDFRPLHDINALRIDYIAERCPLEGASAIDVGCGGGILTEALAGRGARVTGIDLGEAPLAVARLHAIEQGREIDYRRVSVEQIADEAPGRYDLVTCLELLEHVPDPESVVGACARLARPGGTLFFSTINRNPKSWALAILGAEYVLGLLPRGTHDYRKLIRPAELARAVRRAGLVTVEITGMRYNPFSRRAALTRNVDVNYLLHARKP